MSNSRIINSDYVKEVAQIEEGAPNEIKSIVSILGLKPKARILDLCCGYGRHAIPLTQMGYKVTGMEISEPLYNKAKKYAEEAGVDYKLIKGDMRSCGRILKEKYDAVINIFTAFGFYNREADNQRVLNGVEKVLKKGGKFLIDLANRENVLKKWQPRQWYNTGKTTILEESTFDFFSSRIEVKRTFLRENGIKEISDFSLRLYSLHEMLSMIKKSGMFTVAVFGDFEMSQYSVDSRRMILLAQKQ
ncbi:MAG: methyltransferase domain-containing protein [candidate division Zixibacteria bacterium]|nr:methyltransferase domain-containing protein [candidate division Zixibacteria bacterium]